MRCSLMLLAVCTSLVAMRAQDGVSGRLAFEVASVKPNTSGAGGGSLQSPPGRFGATNVSLSGLVLNAYKLASFQLDDVPDWIANDRWDVSAKVPDGVPDGQQMRMLQTLLADRFRLVVHWETREDRVYALTMAEADGRLGPQLSRTTVDCAAIREARQTNPGRPGSAFADGKPVCAMRAAGGRGGFALTAGGMSMEALAKTLASYAGQTVIDRTGLMGEFDFELRFAPAWQLTTAAPSATSDNTPTIFTALPEQLGLKLESARGPVEHLVIDSAARPTPD